ncbi:DUF2935 domain-containing protein [Clostridium brassicae]|uniref:DUF2935 domain-containing protein n=1 Tax=Clostridium brassicae TaxID=2999072 RepID=A0ABT4DBU6_9CLOT|nr:DUF2935 domain-containing protein [Clostridium brassicae]MCY6959767.1 DUF2935 domain-containing protein [Clostridium brassicae]
MYCFTCANSMTCIFNELLLWSEISSEHPIFIKTVGELTKKNLSKSTLNKLMDINKMFSDLRNKAEILSNEQFNYMTYFKTKQLLSEFLLHDKHFLELLPEIQSYGKEDKVWQTLLEHITHEQKFMYQLISNLNLQLR